MITKIIGGGAECDIRMLLRIQRQGLLNLSLRAAPPHHATESVIGVLCCVSDTSDFVPWMMPYATLCEGGPPPHAARERASAALANSAVIFFNHFIVLSPFLFEITVYPLLLNLIYSAPPQFQTFKTDPKSQKTGISDYAVFLLIFIVIYYNINIKLSI
ncbi:MAG: hypothetical protein ACLSB9_37010 [Hydrogeniiclostridium mannosilyticum]